MTDEKDFVWVDRLVEKQKSKLDAEIEELEKENHELMVQLIRAEAIKEFAERLKQKAHFCLLDFNKCEDVHEGVTLVDNLVREMVGDV